MSLVKWSPARRQDRRVDDRAALEQRDVGRSSADVHQRDAHFPLVRREDRLGRRELLEDRVHDLDTRPVGRSSRASAPRRIEPVTMCTSASSRDPDIPTG
jgi:hypothetical protein